MEHRGNGIPSRTGCRVVSNTDKKHMGWTATYRLPSQEDRSKNRFLGSWLGLASLNSQSCRFSYHSKKTIQLGYGTHTWLTLPRPGLWFLNILTFPVPVPCWRNNDFPWTWWIPSKTWKTSLSAAPQEDGRGSFRSKYTSHRWLLCYCWRVGTIMSGQILFYVLSQSPHFLAHDRKNLHVGITELPVHLLNWKQMIQHCKAKFKTNVFFAIKQQWPSKIIIPNMVDMLATQLDLPISDDGQHWTHVAWVHGLEHVTEPLRYQKKTW